jgi:hypothetical protein
MTHLWFSSPPLILSIYSHIVRHHSFFCHASYEALTFIISTTTILVLIFPFTSVFYSSNPFRLFLMSSSSLTSSSSEGAAYTDPSCLWTPYFNWNSHMFGPGTLCFTIPKNFPPSSKLFTRPSSHSTLNFPRNGHHLAHILTAHHPRPLCVVTTTFLSIMFLWTTESQDHPYRPFFFTISITSLFAWDHLGHAALHTSQPLLSSMLYYLAFHTPRFQVPFRTLPPTSSITHPSLRFLSRHSVSSSHLLPTFSPHLQPWLPTRMILSTYSPFPITSATQLHRTLTLEVSTFHYYGFPLPLSHTIVSYCQPSPSQIPPSSSRDGLSSSSINLFSIPSSTLFTPSCLFLLSLLAFYSMPTLVSSPSTYKESEGDIHEDGYKPDCSLVPIPLITIPHSAAYRPLILLSPLSALVLRTLISPFPFPLSLSGHYCPPYYLPTWALLSSIIPLPRHYCLFITPLPGQYCPSLSPLPGHYFSSIRALLSSIIIPIRAASTALLLPLLPGIISLLIIYIWALLVSILPSMSTTLLPGSYHFHHVMWFLYFGWCTFYSTWAFTHPLVDRSRLAGSRGIAARTLRSFFALHMASLLLYLRSLPTNPHYYSRFTVFTCHSIRNTIIFVWYRWNYSRQTRISDRWIEYDTHWRIVSPLFFHLQGDFSTILWCPNQYNISLILLYHKSYPRHSQSCIISNGYIIL